MSSRKTDRRTTFWDSLLGTRGGRRRRLLNRAGRFEQLESRLLLTATARDGIPYIDLGTSDNVAWDQPRVTVELVSAGGSVGPSIFNSMLLDTGANTIIAMATAVSEMDDPPNPYRVEGKFEELGVAGTQIFDISAPYRFDFAGKNGERQTLRGDTRIISDPINDFSQFGPWGVVGMPTMVDRVTTLDFTVWETVQGLDLFMGVEFRDTVPEDNGHRYSIEVDNRLQFHPEPYVVEGAFPPVWGDVPFLTGFPMHNGKVAEGNFLFDTGAQVSVLSERKGLEIGLDSNGDGVLDQNDANFARFETVGGIGGAISVPVFLFDEVHIPTPGGVDLVWTDLQWLVLDIIDGLDGVLGSDLLTSGWIEGFATPGKSGWIDQIQMDFREMNTQGRSTIHFDLNEQVDNLIDPNGPGAKIIESGGATTVSETGIDDTYQIVLTQQPAADVTINLTTNEGEVTAVDDASPARQFLVFTPLNWDQPQTVRVSAIDDFDQESFHRSSIFHVSASTDPAYQAVGMPRLITNIIDDEFAGLMVIPSDGSTDVTEDGESDSYDLVLTVAPSESVTISLDGVGGQVKAVDDRNRSNEYVVFTPANWNVPQTVHVAAVDDAFAEGNHEAFITHGIVTNATEYQDAFALQERVAIVDNDTGGVILNPVSGLTTTESNGEATFTVALRTQPTANVDIAFRSNDESEGIVSPANVRFTPGNWNSPQTVTVTGVDDETIDGPITYAVLTAPAVSADGLYAGLDASDVLVTNVDNDVAGVTITESGSGTQTHEGGATDTYTIALDTVPSQAVEISAEADAQSQISLDGTTFGSRVTFSRVDRTPRTITVRAIDDQLVEGNHASTITHAITGLVRDPNYPTNLVIDDVGIQVTEDFVNANLVLDTFELTGSGFVARFNKQLDTSLLNLIDTSAGGLGPADIVLVGEVGGPVPGSLVLDASRGAIEFVKTGGPLEPDNYTVTLRSADNGLRAITGDMLDGDGNGLPGGDYSGTFTIPEPPANAVVISIPDFVRGPGQPLHLPANSTTGIPLWLSERAGVGTVDMRISYDPALLEFTSATIAPDMPANSSVAFNNSTPGLIVLSFFSPTPLPAGSGPFAHLRAAVPSDSASAIYNRSQVLKPHAVEISSGSDVGFPVIVDRAVHVSAFLGDVSGNGKINTLDASQVAKVATQTDGGFEKSPYTDPGLLGDVSANGRLNLFDARLIAQFATSVPVSEIPAIPSGIAIASARAAGPNSGPPLAGGDVDSPARPSALQKPAANAIDPGELLVRAVDDERYATSVDQVLEEWTARETADDDNESSGFSSLLDSVDLPG